MAKDSSTREQILEGAQKAFGAQGFKASIKDVAREAQISTTSLIFWYFKDKESLFLEVIRQASPLAQVQQVLQSSRGDSPRDTIRMLVKEYLAVYSRPLNRQILFQMLSHASTHPEVQSVLQEQLSQVMSQQMVEIIQAGQDQGEFRRDIAPEFLAQAALGLLFALITRWHVDSKLPWLGDDVAGNLLALLRRPEPCPSDDSQQSP